MIHMCVASKPRGALMRVCSARPTGARQKVLTNKLLLLHVDSPRSAMSAAKLGTRSDRSVGLELGLARRGLDAREGRDVVVEDVLDDDPRPRLALRQVVVEFRRDLAHLRDRAACHLPAYHTARLPMGIHPDPALCACGAGRDLGQVAPRDVGEVVVLVVEPNIVRNIVERTVVGIRLCLALRHIVLRNEVACGGRGAEGVRLGGNAWACGRHAPRVAAPGPAQQRGGTCGVLSTGRGTRRVQLVREEGKGGGAPAVG